MPCCLKDTPYKVRWRWDRVEHMYNNPCDFPPMFVCIHACKWTCMVVQEKKPSLDWIDPNFHNSMMNYFRNIETLLVKPNFVNLLNVIYLRYMHSNIILEQWKGPFHWINKLIINDAPFLTFILDYAQLYTETLWSDQCHIYIINGGGICGGC